MKFFQKWFEEQSFLKRCNDSAKILRKYDGKIPIVIGGASDKSPDINAHKYLVPAEMTVSNFMYLVRTRINIKPAEALFLYISEMTSPELYTDFIPMSTHTIGDIYLKHKSADGFLYIKYELENTFGAS